MPLVVGRRGRAGLPGGCRGDSQGGRRRRCRCAQVKNTSSGRGRGRSVSQASSSAYVQLVGSRSCSRGACRKRAASARTSRAWAASPSQAPGRRTHQVRVVGAVRRRRTGMGNSHPADAPSVVTTTWPSASPSSLTRPAFVGHDPPVEWGCESVPCRDRRGGAQWQDLSDGAAALKSNGDPIMRRIIVGLLGSAIVLVLAAPVSAATTQISGVGVFDSTGECGPPPKGYADFTDFTMVMTGGLEGCWYTKIETSSDSGAPSGVYLETGEEIFVGTLNGGPPGTFTTTYKFESQWDPDVSTGSEVHGRCQHPIVKGSGTGSFKATPPSRLQGRSHHRTVLLPGPHRPTQVAPVPLSRRDGASRHLTPSIANAFRGVPVASASICRRGSSSRSAGPARRPAAARRSSATAGGATRSRTPGASAREAGVPARPARRWGEA